MRSVNNTVDTINAAASAIVSAESRVQQTTVPKRRWGGCWSLYWCFGSHKSSKRIGHALLVPEPQVSGVAASASVVQTRSTAIALRFIAPPSSPASFLQSDPSSASQSPAGLLSLTSCSANAFSPGGPSSIFAVGPYAHETQLVTPPAFSAFTTEPNTAPFTPPPESVHMTTPSSPEVPFAQLLTSSLEQARRGSGTNLKYGLTSGEFQPYQIYSGSPGGQLISPGSVISYSGTSSPFPDGQPILDFRVAEAHKIPGFEHFTVHKWDSRLGSGSLTPDGAGLGSRLASGTVTPNGTGLGSRLGSGTVTPDGVGLRSKVGSGSLTPELVVASSQIVFLLEKEVSEVSSLANFHNGSKVEETMTNHRVSFELSGEEVARCLESKSMSNRAFSGFSENAAAKDQVESVGVPMNSESTTGETVCEAAEKHLPETEEQQCYKKLRSITLGSTKEFNFDSSNGELPDKPNISEWWANETIAGKEPKPTSSWTFFPLLQPEVS